MSFNTKKNIGGIRTVAAVAIYPNACKFSVPETINKGLCTSGQAVDDVYTGTLSVSQSAGSDLVFYQNSTPYLETGSGEMIKINVDSS